MRGLIEGAVVLLVIAGGVWAYGEHKERVGAEEAESERLRERVEELEAAVASRDSAARLRVASLTADIDRLEARGARLDTVVRVRTVALREIVPDSVGPMVDSLVAACDRRIQTCRAAKDSLRSVVLTREGQLAARDSLLAARDSLVTNLERRLDPPFWDSLVDSFGFGATCGLTDDVTPGCAVGVTVTVP